MHIYCWLELGQWQLSEWNLWKSLLVISTSNGSVGWHCHFWQVVPLLPLWPSPLCSYWARSTPQRWQMRAETGGLGQVPSSSSCGRSWLFSPFCTHSLSSDWHGSGGKLSKRHVQIRPNSVAVHLLFEITLLWLWFQYKANPFRANKIVHHWLITVMECHVTWSSTSVEIRSYKIQLYRIIAGWGFQLVKGQYC